MKRSKPQHHASKREHSPAIRGGLQPRTIWFPPTGLYGNRPNLVDSDTAGPFLICGRCHESGVAP